MEVRRLNHGASEGTHYRSEPRRVAGAELALSLRWDLQVIEPLGSKSQWGTKATVIVAVPQFPVTKRLTCYTGCYLIGSSRPHSNLDSSSPQLIL